MKRLHNQHADPLSAPSSLRGLYAITDSTLLPSRPELLSAVESALRGGAALIQYRDKSNDQDKRHADARALARLCQRYQRPLLVNDDIELALAVGADGVHLGQRDGSIALARARLGAGALIGVTCHDSLALAAQAEQEGADYVAFGAFFVSSTKPDAKPAPLSLLAEARRRLRVPVVAIGGITRDNAPSVIDQGAEMLAVIGALFATPDVTANANGFSRLFR